MMPLFNAHGLDPNWVEPDELKVQEFFDTLHEAYVTDEPRLVQDTSQVELDYIARRLREARLAEESARLAVEAGSAGGTVDSATAEAAEEDLSRWAAAAGEASGAGAGAPLVEDIVDEASEEDDEEEIAASVPPATRRGRVLRRAASGEPVCPSRAAQLWLAQGAATRQTRAAVTKKAAEAEAARRKTPASSSSRRAQTPPPSPLPADVGAGIAFDFGPLSPERYSGPPSPERKRKATEEEEEEK